MTPAAVLATGALTLPSRDELAQRFRAKYYGDGSIPGWSPQLRERFGYFTPDDYYEAVVARLVVPGSAWADIGCGRDIFPHNPRLAAQLATRCAYVYGIDPDDNVRQNNMVHAYFQGLVEHCNTSHTFDVVTMRMVAEHIVDPAPAIGRVCSLLKPGGTAVIYTPHKFAPMSLVAAIVPFSLHNPMKRWIWNSEARDTFPTAYKLNTYSDLLQHTVAAGLVERLYAELDDCRTLAAFRWLNTVELWLQSALQRVSIPYPERCILAVYQRPLS